MARLQVVHTDSQSIYRQSINVPTFKHYLCPGIDKHGLLERINACVEVDQSITCCAAQDQIYILYVRHAYCF